MDKQWGGGNGHHMAGGGGWTADGSKGFTASSGDGHKGFGGYGCTGGSRGPGRGGKTHGSSHGRHSGRSGSMGGRMGRQRGMGGPAFGNDAGSGGYGYGSGFASQAESPAAPVEAEGTASLKLDFSPPACAAQLDPARRAMVDAYVEKWGPLLQAELDATRAISDERLRNWPLQRLCQDGLVLLDLRGCFNGMYFGKSMLLFRQADGGDLPFHRFNAGDLVTLSKRDPVTERTFDALVLDKGRWEIRLVIDRQPPQLESQMWRIDCGINVTSFQRSAAALRSLYKTPTNQHPLMPWASPPAAPQQGIQSHAQAPEELDPEHNPRIIPYRYALATDGHVIVGGGGHGGRRGKGKGRKRKAAEEDAEEADNLPPGCCVRDALISSERFAGSVAGAAAELQGGPALLPLAAVEWAAAQLSRFKELQQGPGGSSILLEEDPEVQLNRSQVAAIATAMQSPISLLQGPPGTGKTTTIVKFIKLMRQSFGFGLPVLACAQSNVAVDNLLEGLVDSGVTAVRTGQPVKVREGLRDATLDARLLRHPLQAELSTALGRQQDLKFRLPALQGRDRGLGHRDMSILKKEVKRLKVQISSDILKGAEVICSTCVGAGAEQLQEMCFALVVLDEGSQCSEPESLIPLVRGAAQVVLVGDQCQLPPVVVSKAAADGRGLDLSLFERLISRGLPSAMLRVQYRMHPSLSEFPNSEFYQGQLLDGVAAAARPRPQGPYGQSILFPGAGCSVVFVDVVPGCEVSTQGGSKSNEAEANMVMMLVQHLQGALGEELSGIGLVTPYLAQVQALSARMRRLAATRSSPEVEVKSVDGYQGREKDIIVFSCVRSNAHCEVGFLSDWRRLNVAITRARRGLIVVGNARTLQGGDARWARYLEWLKSRGCVTTAAVMLSQMRQEQSRGRA